MKKLIALSLGLLLVSFAANCNVPVNGTNTSTFTVIDEPVTVTTFVAVPVTSGCGGDGAIVAPSAYNDGYTNEYYQDIPSDYDQPGYSWEDVYQILPWIFIFLFW
jgi:hypothetical protein